MFNPWCMISKCDTSKVAALYSMDSSITLKMCGEKEIYTQSIDVTDVLGMAPRHKKAGSFLLTEVNG